MNIEDQVAALFAKANPVPSLALLDPIEPVDIDSLRNRPERSRDMSEATTFDDGGKSVRRDQSRGLLVAAAVAAVVIAIGIGVFAASPGHRSRRRR